MTEAIWLDGVSKVYAQGSPALHPVQLRLKAHQLTTVLGPSGCGKTTLLRLVAGLEQVSSGRIWMQGQDVTTWPAHQRPISMVFQNYALFPHLSVAANVAYGLGRQGTQHERDQQVLRALQQVNLAHLRDTQTHALSGGQQQRVAVARCLAMQAPVMLMDEPLSNLDAGLRRHISDDIRQLQQQLGLTVLYVTHDHHEAMCLSDELVVMNQGHVMQTGTPRAIYDHPHSEFVATHLGDASLLDAQCDDNGYLHLGPLKLALDWQGRAGAVRLIVRPFAWLLDAASGDGLAGRISSCAQLGRKAEYRVETALGELLVHQHDVAVLRPLHSPVSLHLRSHGISVLPITQT